MKMKHETATSFSHNGEEHKADKAGVIDIPDEAVAVALEFGFVPVPAKAAKAE